MTLLAIPAIEPPEQRWPSLGDGVCDWLEAFAVYGPGPLKGERYRVEPEFRAQINRLYEVFPKGHPRAGRRRFKRGVLSMRKGTAKSEKGALLCIAEAHPEAPVRFDGWGADGRPIGRGLVDPYVPMMAYTEEQSEDLAFGVLRAIIEHSDDLAGDFDVSLERVLVLDHLGREAGKIQPLAQSPSARDGARTTFQHFDETHRLTSPRHIAARATMLENLFKRVDADAWQLGTTTAGDPNEASIARDDHEEAEQIARGEVDVPTLCYIHRFCPIEQFPPTDPDTGREVKVTPEHVRDALLTASGPAASWSADIDALVDNYFAPKTDRLYWRRVWLNQWIAGGGRAFDVAQARALIVVRRVKRDQFVTLGFDGARTRDTTALVATDIRSGYQWPVDCWRRPAHVDEFDDWEVDPAEVDAAVCDCFAELDVWRLYGDPPHWGEWLDTWAGKFGSTRVVKWWTTRQRQMGHALREYRQAMADETIGFADDELFFDHLGNAVKRVTNLAVGGDTDERLWLIEKDRPDSPRKIDLAMAGALSWQARLDAIAAGAKPTRTGRKGARAYSF